MQPNVDPTMITLLKRYVDDTLRGDDPLADALENKILNRLSKIGRNQDRATVLALVANIRQRLKQLAGHLIEVEPAVEIAGNEWTQYEEPRSAP